MTGTLRATRIPYSSDSEEFDAAMDALDEHAGCYPIRGELRVRQLVSVVPKEEPIFCAHNPEAAFARRQDFTQF